MKKTIKLQALLLSLMMLLGLTIPATAQRSDGFFKSYNNNYENRAEGINDNTGNGGIQNDPFGAPLGSGLLILTAVGAGYAVAKRRRNKGVNALVLVIAIILFMPSCRKKIVEPVNNTTQTNGVNITLNVGDGSKVNVDPNGSPMVSFENGDKILVGYDGKYVGTITHNGSYFTGNITATQNGEQPLYFYFFGNKYTGTLTEGTTTSCTVDISSQSTELPVLSFSASKEVYTGAGSYSASLHNQCALVKFTLANPAGSTRVGGMHTEATINFATPGISKTGTTGQIRLYNESSTVKWAILLPQNAVDNAAVSIGNQNLTVNVPEITKNAYITNITAIANETALLDLSAVTAETSDEDRTAKDGWEITGTLGVNKQIMIADGATVTLDNATINYNSNYPGITCLGNAEIILAGTNTVNGKGSNCAGIQIGESGTTLTISGNGSLSATGNSWAAGIGLSSSNTVGGNIVINGGNITAQGGHFAAGIGTGCNSDYSLTMGSITINGGSVTAIGGNDGAGIGTGFSYENLSTGDITITGGTVYANGGAPSCGDFSGGAGIGTGCNIYGYADVINQVGNITITSSVTMVRATRGSASTVSIGYSPGGSRGTITIGGVVKDNISTSPYVYNPNPTPPPTPSAPTEGALSGLFTINDNGDQIYFSQGNLQYIGSASTPYWKFAENQWDYFGTTTGQNSYATNKDRDLFCWGTASNPWEYDGEFNEWHDWGNNAISNGGNTTNQWRTLTHTEWEYLFENTDRTQKRYLHATITVGSNNYKGAIIFPDDFEGVGSYSYNNNYQTLASVSEEDWTAMETAGAVFLPKAGYRYYSSVYEVNDYGYYWASDYESFSEPDPGADPEDPDPPSIEVIMPYYIELRNSYYVFNPTSGDQGCSVRLVKDVN